MDIIGLSKEELYCLNPLRIDRSLTEEEVVYIAKALGAYWSYDYEASGSGRVGMHAVSKSGLHSDGFFISRILFQSPNILKIVADQMVLKFRELGMKDPDWVAGIPDGATSLGHFIARSFGAGIALLEKTDGRIFLRSTFGSADTLLLVEDFCTRGTGFSEAVWRIASSDNHVNLLPLELVVINRGGLKRVSVAAVGTFPIVAVVDHKVSDWEAEKCPLCKRGSVPIKPKATDDNWRIIVTSQLE